MNKNESKYFNTALKMDDALVSLLEKEDFEFISVKEICKTAGVNRSTFYLHYMDVCDLLTEVIENLNKSFNEHINTKENMQIILNKKDKKDLFFIKDEYLFPYLEFIKENRKIYKAIRKNPQVFKTDKTYEKMFSGVFSPILTRFGLDVRWHHYLMDFYINGISSLVLDWVYDDCRYEINEVASFIERLIVKYDETAE